MNQLYIVISADNQQEGPLTPPTISTEGDELHIPYTMSPLDSCRGGFRPKKSSAKVRDGSAHKKGKKGGCSK